MAVWCKSPTKLPCRTQSQAFSATLAIGSKATEMETTAGYTQAMHQIASGNRSDLRLDSLSAAQNSNPARRLRLSVQVLNDSAHNCSVLGGQLAWLSSPKNRTRRGRAVTLTVAVSMALCLTDLRILAG